MFMNMFLKSDICINICCCCQVCLPHKDRSYNDQNTTVSTIKTHISDKYFSSCLSGSKHKFCKTGKRNTFHFLCLVWDSNFEVPTIKNFPMSHLNKAKKLLTGSGKKCWSKIFFWKRNDWRKTSKFHWFKGFTVPGCWVGKTFRGRSSCECTAGESKLIVSSDHNRSNIDVLCPTR